MNLIGRDKVAGPRQRPVRGRTRTAGQFAKGKTGMMIYQNNAENNLKSNGMPKSATASRTCRSTDGSSKPIMTHVAGINRRSSRTPKGRGARRS